MGRRLVPRAVVDRWAGSLPWINVFFARMGQVIGTREFIDCDGNALEPDEPRAAV